MEYYLLAQSEHVVNPIKVIGPNLEGYPHEMTHRQFAGLEDAVVGYVRYDETQEIPDILSQPTYMVSEAIKKVLAMYDDNISFKAVQIFPNEQSQIPSVARVYWIYDCVMEECIHADAIKLPNGAYQEIIIDKRKIKGRNIKGITAKSDCCVAGGCGEHSSKKSLWSVVEKSRNEVKKCHRIKNSMCIG